MTARTTETTEKTDAAGTPASVNTLATSAHLQTAGLSSMMATTAGTPAIAGKPEFAGTPATENTQATETIRW